ncbi:beta-N-acetylhexosaminidase [Peterkaempfera bronchialis]|uniref:beta-N-acetylhexosaminidase n=1 Tax=Peterkaempfera bronchialis TaxID=2126346 RepID=A0A345SVL0_9ACTN|nr:beta-N-acetylhexosaminidase [Peterkaempfera bronchialis]AXI77765.1 beta-N-acetylhexosaminidase [Peterkaempfera bronchialis]
MDLVPAPLDAHRYGDGKSIALGPGTALTAGPGAEQAERWLRAELSAATGFRLAPGECGAADAVRLAVHPLVTEELGPEGYQIMVSPNGVDVFGGGPAGVFWGAQTLRQLLGPDAYRRAPLAGRSWQLPICQLQDAPRFAWRGLLLDVARHFLPKHEVLRYLDLMAAHKLNVLQLHLTDDQGWRMEIRRHPRLTEVGGWRERSMVGFRAGGRRDDRPHGGRYTQDDLREIVAYAAERQITVVPEIDIPGHTQAAIAAYPGLGNTDVVDTAALRPWTDWGVNPHVLNAEESTLRFFEEVLEEVLEVFPSTFVHLGGDECPKDEWRASPAAQARIRELGVAGEEGLQSWFVRHFDRWLAERGRRLIGWDEILEGGLPPGAAVSSWRGYAGGVTAARAGHDVVMCPEQQVYLDHRQADGEDEPIPVGFVRTVADVYRFEPVPPQLRDDPAAAARVIGAQANMWTEMADSARDVDYRLFPRLAAFAEVAWSRLPADPAERDLAGFERRLTAHLARLDALGVEYRPPTGPHPWQRWPGVVGRPLEGPPPAV